MSYLLDTCILSKLRKSIKFPDPPLEKWIKSHSSQTYFISVLSLGEIQMGISKLSLSKPADVLKKSVLEDWFFERLIPRFAPQTLEIKPAITLAWGKLIMEKQQQGLVIPSIDGLLAATALVHNLTMVTENTQDFKEIGVRLFNPWL